MRVMIFGDSATGKSTFADNLGKKLQIPVTHLDELMDSVGRNNKDLIRETIQEKIKENDWIIDGNAFTKDRDARIHAADIVVIFNKNPMVSLLLHCFRTLKIKMGLEERKGSNSKNLNLQYFVPYIFFKFPERKEAARNLAKSLGKEVKEINTLVQAEAALTEIK